MGRRAKAAEGGGRVARARTSYAELQGLGRALNLLEQLAERPMRAKELADALELKWTTVYRMLTHLRESGYLTRDESTGVYYIGSRLYYIGSSYIANLPILQTAHVFLKTAAQQTGTTAQLVERNGDRAMNILVFEPTGEYIPKTDIGFHFPLHCGSKGHVLLAFAGEEEIDEYLSRPLVALTPYTLTDVGELRERLAATRTNGYAVTKRDVQLSTASVAAPVRDAADAVIASVTLIANWADFEQLETRLVDVVINAARSISLATGWRRQLATGRVVSHVGSTP